MSELARSFAAQKLADLPKEPPQPLPATPEDREDEYSSESSLSSTGTVLPSPSQHLVPAPPVQWTKYFAQELFLQHKLPSADEAKYHVYLTQPANLKSPLFVCHHGAGASGMSFAPFALSLRAALPSAGILSIEARQHGSSILNPDGDTVNDFSIAVLRDDLANMITLVRERLGWSSLPPIILVGHSLGGAVAVELAQKGILGTSLLGYVVIDVVEGSAIEALKYMQGILSSRPSSFLTLESAIDWHLRSRNLRNRESAAVSVPSLLRRTADGKWAWATDLAITQPFWEGWFQGMSQKFLSAKGAKLLILAGTDRLDKDLMIGQMQGKFQLQVVPEAGHFVQEDAPEKTAEMVVEFFKRNDRSALVLPPKVSDLIAQGKKV
ncbi:protein phosphatase methylesteras-like protein 1 [Viridothelium virens]|uniref:Protein phosphatase methylesterase 1 n=1 Tax=Viridothelium virens TaxID=1048519 RepID=A0A6A6HAD0_VIRVR|nr:protein phosphatase methylesteras-like protein 1 [Viridothelium virens]